LATLINLALHQVIQLQLAKKQTTMDDPSHPAA